MGDSSAGCVDESNQAGIEVGQENKESWEMRKSRK